MPSPVGDSVNVLSRVQTWAPESQSTTTTTTQGQATPTAGAPRHQRWLSNPENGFPQMPSIPEANTITNSSINNNNTDAQASRRRSSATPSDTGVVGPNRNAAKRAAHNVIEKRYRTNMNAKFVALEKAMSADGVDRSTKGGSASLKKSEILTNAIAYIQELQEESQSTKKELQLLKQTVMAGGVWKRN